jgi:hypothetical protein
MLYPDLDHLHYIQHGATNVALIGTSGPRICEKHVNF